MRNGQVVWNQQIQIQQQQQPQSLQLQPPKAIFDAAIQTISTDRNDQTDNPERKDFQAQAHFEKQGESIATQTENPEKCDSENQANIQQVFNTP